MRVLLDTNIIIHREGKTVVNDAIGTLFYWLDKLHHEKCVHPLSIEELNRHADAQLVKSLNIKLQSYSVLKTEAKIHQAVQEVSMKNDVTDNDHNDSKLLNEVYCNRVELLITQDRKIHSKAAELNISDKVFTIDSFVGNARYENPGLIDYKVLSVRTELFGNINVQDEFFDSFRDDYLGFDAWFNKKADEIAYVCYNDASVGAFLYLKIEERDENYFDILPQFDQKRRLKIGTFKVSWGIKIAERFLYIVFDNAWRNKVEEIYVTLFEKNTGHTMLINLFEDWGFVYHGIKTTDSGEEKVFVRSFGNDFNPNHPKITYPRLSNEGLHKTNRVFIVPIYPEYHTELFPDSILRTEKTEDFTDSQPHRNAISKAYISHSWERGLAPGDIIVFYRTGDKAPKKYSGVATTIGIVENVVDNIPNFDELFRSCIRRTVLTKNELKEFWDRYPRTRPFVVNFLFAFSFKKRANLVKLNELGVIPDINDMPRGYREISWEMFAKLVKYSGI